LQVFLLYQEFFNFLEKIPSDPRQHSKKWPLFCGEYYHPNKAFLDAYFSHSPLSDSAVLEERVKAVKAADYSWLKSLCAFLPPEKIIHEAYEECVNVVSPPEEPEIYLFIGFFSPDGFVMSFQGKPVIGFGLERFRDFRLLHVIFAHEYVHFLLNLMNAEVPEQKSLQWFLVSEGLGTIFPSLVFPGLPLSDYFLFRGDRLNWCQANESRLKEIYCSGRFSPRELIDFYDKGNPEMGLPPRAAKYLGFQAIKRHLAQNPEVNLPMLLLDKYSALSIEI